MSHSASLSGAQESLINAVLSRLANIEGYPFDEGVDRPLLERKILQYPNANFSHRLCEDINMWLEHPRMMGENPREYLDEWFDEEIANCLED